MRKHNIGRISIIILAVNFILIAIALVAGYRVDEPVQITRDASVDEAYYNVFEDMVMNMDLSNSEVKKFRSYDWYLTDIPENTTSYKVSGDDVMIYAADENFIKYADNAVACVLTGENCCETAQEQGTIKNLVRDSVQ